MPLTSQERSELEALERELAPASPRGLSAEEGAELRALEAEIGPSVVSQAPGERPGLGRDVLVGHEAAMRNILGHVGVPWTDYDLGNLLQGMQLVRPKAAIEKEYSKAGPLAGAVKLGSELFATAPIGGLVARGIASLAPAAATLPGPLLSAAKSPFIGNAARSAVEGGTAGALTGDDQGVGSNVAQGALYGAIGDKVIRGLGKFVTGVGHISKDAMLLSKLGLPFTAGQAADDTMPGRIMRGLEETAMSVPISRQIMEGGRERGPEALRAFALRQAAPPGFKVTPDAAKTPIEALEDIGLAFNASYGALLRSPEAMKIALPSGAAARKKALAAAFNLTSFDLMTEKARADVSSHIKRLFSAGDETANTLTPDQMFQIQSALRKTAREYEVSGNPVGRSMGRAFMRAAGHVFSEVDRAVGSSGSLRELAKPYKTYAALTKEATNLAGHGQFLTPRQLQKVALKSKNRELGEAAKAAASVYPSRTPDSGTATRAAMIALLGGGGAYLGGSYGNDSGASYGNQILGAGLGLAIPSLMSRSTAGTKLMLGDTRAQKAIANALRQYGATAAGIYGAQ